MNWHCHCTLRIFVWQFTQYLFQKAFYSFHEFRVIISFKQSMCDFLMDFSQRLHRFTENFQLHFYGCIVFIRIVWKCENHKPTHSTQFFVDKCTKYVDLLGARAESNVKNYSHFWTRKGLKSVNSKVTIAQIFLLQNFLANLRTNRFYSFINDLFLPMLFKSI
jgi:hypothetical protein